jgi:hypothetical protein
VVLPQERPDFYRLGKRLPQLRFGEVGRTQQQRNAGRENN